MTGRQQLARRRAVLCPRSQGAEDRAGTQAPVTYKVVGAKVINFSRVHLSVVILKGAPEKQSRVLGQETSVQVFS